MKTLEMKEMESIRGGQVENCSDFMEVLGWLLENDHDDQAAEITDLYFYQYCG